MSILWGHSGRIWPKFKTFYEVRVKQRLPFCCPITFSPCFVTLYSCLGQSCHSGTQWHSEVGDKTFCHSSFLEDVLLSRPQSYGPQPLPTSILKSLFALLSRFPKKRTLTFMRSQNYCLSYDLVEWRQIRILAELADRTIRIKSNGLDNVLFGVN